MNMNVPLIYIGFRICQAKLKAPNLLKAANLNHNDKYGEFVITPALIMGMDETIIDRISFGSVRKLEELYQQ